MMFSDLSLWIFGVCVVSFLVGIGLMIKSYRDAKYAAYYFLREEAALRVKRLLFVLVPLAVIIVFLGLRLFGPEPQGILVDGPTPTASTAQTTTQSATVTLTATAAAAVAATAPALSETSMAQPATVQVTSAASPTTAGNPELTLTATSTAALSTGVALTVTPDIPTAAAPVTPTGSATTTVTVTSTVTSTPTPPFSTVTPRPDAAVGPILFSRAISPDNTPRNPATAFSTGDNYIYAFFDYRNMANGALWSTVWLKGNEQIGGETNVWPYGSDGRAYVYFAPLGGYQPGKYELRIRVGDRQLQSAAFDVR